MELDLRREKSPESKRQLVSLPLDVLDLILWFSSTNAYANLLMAGDRLLSTKLRKTRHLTLQWESTSYFDWYNCKSLILSFHRLESLRLTSWSPELLCRQRLESDLFPSTLMTLTLNFRGALELLGPFGHIMQEPLLHLTQLHTLNVSQAHPSTSADIDFRQLPSSLTSLHIHAPGKNYRYHVNELHYLPPNLTSLSLQLNFYDHLGPIVLGQGVPGELASLTDLSIRLCSRNSLEINLVSSHLKRLHVLNGMILYKGLDLLSPDSHLHLAYDWPLESFKSNVYHFEWSNLVCFPPSLTEIGAANMELHNDDLDVLKHMNEDFIAQGASCRHTAPINLRSIELYKPGITLDPHLLPFLPNLAKVSPPLVHVERTSLQTLPKGLNQHLITMPDINLKDAYRLPTFLNSLSVDRFLLYTSSHSHDTVNIAQKSQPRSETQFDDFILHPALDPPMHGLRSLDIHIEFSEELIAYLPRTLEKFSAPMSESTTKLFTIHVNDNAGLPYLSELTFAPHLNPSSSVQECSLLTVPKSITRLVVKNSVSFSKSANMRLLHHSKLMDLTFAVAIDPVVALEEFPSQLKFLHFCFSTGLDLNDVKASLALYNFGRRMHNLKVLSLRDDEAAGTTLLTPMARHSAHPLPTLLQWMQFPMKLKALYLIKSLRLGHKTYAHASELFFLSCLPRRLSAFHAPSWSIHTTIGYRGSYVSRIAYFLSFILMPAIRFQIPLLDPFCGIRIGYLDTHHTTNLYLDVLVRPPQLSVPMSANDSWEESAILNCGLFANVTGHRMEYTFSKPRQLVAPIRFSPAPSAFHISNVLLWLLVSYLYPVSKVAHPWLWYYQWANIVGSSIAFPFVFGKWIHTWWQARHRLYRPEHRGVLILTSIASIIGTFGWAIPAARNFGWFDSILCWTFAVGSSLFRNAVLHYTDHSELTL